MLGGLIINVNHKTFFLIQDTICKYFKINVLLLFIIYSSLI